jgi:RNA polymerase sigma factor for flagellar operon FliA
VHSYYKEQQREQRIVSNLELVKFQALRLYARVPSSVELNDLMSYGVMGLMDAVDKFDESRGVKFKTYAELRIRGAILDGLRELDWIPRSLRKRQKELEAAFHKLENILGRAAEDEEVAAELGLEIEDYFGLLNDLKGVTLGSLESSGGDSEDSPLNYLADSEENLPTVAVEKKQVKELLVKAIDLLPDKEKLVLSLYYFEGLTMKEVGKVLDITESRVSQLHSKAVLRMRGKISKSLGMDE